MDFLAAMLDWLFAEWTFGDWIVASFVTTLALLTIVSLAAVLDALRARHLGWLPPSWSYSDSYDESATAPKKRPFFAPVCRVCMMADRTVAGPEWLCLTCLRTSGRNATSKGSKETT